MTPMPTREEILSRLRGFVDDNFLYMRPDFELQTDTSLLRHGILDSMGVMEMVEFISSEFDVTVADADITEANIGTLASIADYVLSHRADAGRQIA